MRVLRLAMLLAAFCVVTAGVSGDDKPAKGHGQLPQNYGKLGLSDDQKTKIYSISTKYQKEIDDLKAKIDAAKEKERKEQEGVLTEAQKQKLRDIMAGKAPADDKK